VNRASHTWTEHACRPYRGTAKDGTITRYHTREDVLLNLLPKWDKTDRQMGGHQNDALHLLLGCGQQNNGALGTTNINSSTQYYTIHKFTVFQQKKMAIMSNKLLVIFTDQLIGQT